MKRAISNHALLRWFWLVLIALAEVTWLAIRIEAPPAGLLSYTKGFPSIFVTSLAVATVLGWARYRGRLLELPIFQDFSHRSWPFVLAHTGAFAAFFWLTILIFEGDVESSRFPALWILAWAATGFGAGVFWILAAMPAREWIRLARQSSSFILPGIIIFAALWVLGFLANRAWEPLQGPTFLVVQWLMQVFQQDVVCQPADHLVGTAQFSVGIYPACAGYEGIGLMVVFVGGYLWFLRRRLRFPHAVILLPCAILIIWLVNAVRIASLIMFGTHVSPEIALGGFHSQVGWLSFIVVALGLVGVTQRMPFFAVTQSKFKDKVEAEGETKVKAEGANRTGAYLAPLMALLAVTMVTGVFSSGFDWPYPARLIGTGAAIWFFWRRSMTRLHLAQSWSWGAVAIGVTVFAVWMGLEWATGGPDTGSSMAKALGDMPAGLAAAWLLFRVLGSVVTVPIAEELAFRGYLLRRLISADFEKISSPRLTWLSFLVSSVLFGALHGRWLAGTVAGMFFAWAMYRRGRVGDAIIAHATTNALIAADVLIFGNWGLWK